MERWNGVVTWLASSSVLLTEIVRQVMIGGPLFGLFTLTEEQHNWIISAMSAVFGIIIAKTTVPHVKVQERLQEAHDRADAKVEQRVADIISNPEEMAARVALREEGTP